MSSISIKHLFDIHRFQNQQDFPKILLYFPFGLILLLFRLAICVLTWPIFIVLPRTSNLRSFLMKVICILFGVFVKQDLLHRNQRVKLLICNHISVLDYIIVDSVLTCRQIDNCSHFSEWNIPSVFHFPTGGSQTEMMNPAIDSLQRYVDGSDVAVMVFPEGAMTNGKFGLLKFSTWPFTLSSEVQPAVIHVANVSLIKISPNVLGTSIWCDLLWLLFVPYTVFSLKVLPTITRNENESVEEFSKRTQAYMASALNLTPTLYTLKDKVEYEKHLMALPASTAETLWSAQSRMSNEPTAEINRMAVQIKEILPAVPFSIIQQDIEITKSVDETILRILEGVVHYVPENIPSSSSTLITNSSDSRFTYSSISSYSTGKEVLPSLNTAVEAFGKTSKDRMKSYQERKAALINAARMRYLKKHELM